jgi:hypothetical protein
MYPREEEEAAGNGLYWFNYWSPTEKELAGKFRNDNWMFFAKALHSVSFAGKIDVTLKYYSPLPASYQEQGQQEEIAQETVIEAKINLLTDKGKIIKST